MLDQALPRMKCPIQPKTLSVAYQSFAFVQAKIHDSCVIENHRWILLERNSHGTPMMAIGRWQKPKVSLI